MHKYAQTNIQLFNQMKDIGYTEEDLVLIYKIYQFAIRTFAGVYRPSGKTFIAHVIGTASILASLKTHINIVAAGLIHSLYNEGDFGFMTMKITNSKRNYIRKLVGSEIEIYVFNYANFIPDRQTLSYINANISKLDSLERSVLLMRLADRLEDCLDLGHIYHSDADFKGLQNYLRNSGALLAELASKLGFPHLAKELEIASVEIEIASAQSIQGKIFEGVHGPATGGNSFLIPPVSYRKRLSVIFYQAFSRFLNYR